MAAISSHYERLGVRPDADAASIRDAYRRLARVHHPDARGGRPSSEMPAINEAYRVLSDPGRRLDYDRALRATGSAAASSSARASSPRPTYTAPRYDPISRYSEPPRFPWRFVLLLVVVGTTAILVLGALMGPPGPASIDNILRAGDCVVIEPTTRVAGEVGCDAVYDAVVDALVPFDVPCPSDTEAYRDRQGMGTACVRRP